MGIDKDKLLNLLMKLKESNTRLPKSVLVDLKKSIKDHKEITADKIAEDVTHPDDIAEVKVNEIPATKIDVLNKNKKEGKLKRFINSRNNRKNLKKR